MNKRTREMILWIIERKNYQESCTIQNLMDKFNVSERTIRYDLDEISEFFLESNISPLEFKDHGIIEINGNSDNIIFNLDQNDFYSFKLSKEERMDMIMYLIISTLDHVTLQQLADILWLNHFSFGF